MRLDCGEKPIRLLSVRYQMLSVKSMIIKKEEVGHNHIGFCSIFCKRQQLLMVPKYLNKRTFVISNELPKVKIELS